MVGEPVEGGRRRIPFWPVALVAAYDSVGYAVVGPVLPALRTRAHATPLLASLIFSAFSVGLVAGFSLAGGVTRRWGPRVTLLCGVSAHLLGDVLFVSGHNAGLYALARFAQGLGSGGLWLGAMLAALTWWADLPGPKLGGVLAGYAVGAVAGPLLGALGGTVRPFLADGGLAVVAATAALALPAGRGRPFGWHLRALKDRRLLFASAVILLSSLVYSSIEGSFTLRFSSHLSQAGLGALIAVTAMTAGIGSTLPIATGGRRGVRAGRWAGGVAGGRVVAQAGSVMAGLLLIAVTSSDSPAAWFVLLGMVGLVLGAAESGSLAMVARMPEGGMLTAQVAYSQVWALGFLVGPPGTTWLATSAGKVAPGLALAAVGLAAAALGFWVREIHTSVRQAVDGEDGP